MKSRRPKGPAKNVRTPGGRSNWFSSADTLDLHRFTAEDAEETLEKFLDRRAVAGSSGVLIIHGAKLLAGVVARVVRNHPLVDGSEPDNSGATRVWLSGPR